MADRTDRWWFGVGAACVAAAVVLGASIGPAGPDWWRVPLEFVNRLPLISIETGVSESEWAIVWKIRMPRVVLGGVVGGMLSIAGASYQGVFRNPLVGPYLLGAAAGAGLGATLALTVGRGGDVVLGRRPGPDRSVRRRRRERDGDLHRGSSFRG